VQQSGEDVVHVLEAALVDVGRLVHVVELAVEVARGDGVLGLDGRLQRREHLVEVFIEAGAGEEVEHAAREEERDHLALREPDRLVARGRHQPPDLAPSDALLGERLARSLERLQVAQGGAGVHVEARGDVVDGRQGEMGDAHMGVQARLMSQALRKLTATCSKSRTLVIFHHQLRMKIGVMFGNPETTTGGTRPQVFASVRLDVRPHRPIQGPPRQGQRGLGHRNRTRVKVPRTRSLRPSETGFDVLYGQASRSSARSSTSGDAQLIERWELVLLQRRAHRPGAESARKFPHHHPRRCRHPEQLLQSWGPAP
jgi:hypothetical protein